MALSGKSIFVCSLRQEIMGALEQNGDKGRDILKVENMGSVTLLNEGVRDRKDLS